MPDYEAPTFIDEELPPIRRESRSAHPWEEHLAPIKEVTPGTFRRVFTFDEKPKAVARSNAIRRRWLQAVPLEHITTVVRQIPDSDQWGVYLAHHGTITQAKRNELNAAAEERGVRVRESRAADKASESPSRTPRTAAERVAAAKAAKAS